MNIDRALTLLRRAPVWAERNRHDGYVVLEGLGRDGMLITEVFLEADLTELLKTNEIKCDTSQRLADRPNSVRRPTQEVTNKYWSVVE